MYFKVTVSDDIELKCVAGRRVFFSTSYLKVDAQTVQAARSLSLHVTFYAIQKQLIRKLLLFGSNPAFRNQMSQGFTF